MCRLVSFLHRPDNGDIAVYDLTSHSETQKKLNLQEPLWCEGHYLPSGEIECRVTDKNRKTKEECEERLRNRFPTFSDFFVWAISQDEIISSDGFDLRGLTSLPSGVKFPAECGSLDLRGLTSLPSGVKFPAECGYLDLSGLTSLPSGVKFPEKISGSLDLRGLTSLPSGVKFPAECGYLYLRGLTSLPSGVKFPAECGYLYLRSDLEKEYYDKQNSKKRKTKK